MGRQNTSPRRWLVLTGTALTVALVGLIVPSTVAYERYNDGCDSGDCHGSFTGGVSPKGTVFPSNSKHEMHRGSANMEADCDLCHIGGGFSNPYIGDSNGTANNPGLGCVGCHGRDYGGGVGNSGVGLRAHHTINGVASCAGCHSDDPAPLPENILPTYYGTPDTKADDPCNMPPDFLENWSIGDDFGLDNDGDNLYDAADGDCADCPADFDGDGDIDTADLLHLLGAWGTPDGDVDGDGDTDTADLLGLLGNWGDCP